MLDERDPATKIDAAFFRALVLGVAIGIPVFWGALTAIFAATTSHGWLNAVAYSALPAFFCGPFFGGLATTSIAHVRAERAGHE
jgi:hypothetical protein